MVLLIVTPCQWNKGATWKDFHRQQIANNSGFVVIWVQGSLGKNKQNGLVFNPRYYSIKRKEDIYKHA